MLIRQALHFAQNTEREEEPTDPLCKIRLLDTHFHSRMNAIQGSHCSIESHYPRHHLSIDESMMTWRGCLSICQYIKMKHHKFGVKLYVLAVPDWLAYKFIMYTGGTNREISGWVMLVELSINC